MSVVTHCGHRAGSEAGTEWVVMFGVIECSVGVNGWETGVSSHILDGYTRIIACVLRPLEGFC